MVMPFSTMFKNKAVGHFPKSKVICGCWGQLGPALRYCRPVGGAIQVGLGARACRFEPWSMLKVRCKECGESEVCSQVCKHGKQKAMCKECGGSQVCEHGRQNPRTTIHPTSSLKNL